MGAEGVDIQKEPTPPTHVPKQVPPLPGLPYCLSYPRNCHWGRFSALGLGGIWCRATAGRVDFVYGTLGIAYCCPPGRCTGERLFGNTASACRRTASQKTPQEHHMGQSSSVSTGGCRPGPREFLGKPTSGSVLTIRKDGALRDSGGSGCQLSHVALSCARPV